MASYTTSQFHGTPSGFARHVGAMWLGRWWWVVTLPIVLCLLLSINEATWLFVTLMLVFMLYPGLTMMVYFNYAFSPEARRTLYEQTVTVTDCKITVSYIEKNYTADYGVNDVVGVEFNSKHTLIKLKHPRYNHIAIPLTAVDDAHKQQFYDILANYDTTRN
jgi:hypothetical protein